jgi:fructose-specific phosphotransferase system IIC component
MKGLRYLVDGSITLAVGVGVAFGLGALFVWLWAPTPTPENSSPPPEAFLFVIGALVGLLATVFVRVALRRLWLRRRRQLG